MKQHGILLPYGIVLMSIFFYATPTATSNPEDCSPGLKFTKLAWNDIVISWNRTCFNNDTSYDITLIGDKSCNRANYDCSTGSTCQIGIIGGMSQSCPGNLITPCTPATYIVAGSNKEDLLLSVSTTIPPWFRKADWKLENSTAINQDEKILVAKWGPPDNDYKYISCATKATVSATCNHIDENNIPISKVANITHPESDQGTAELSIDGCAKGNVTAMVTYMSEVTYISEDNRSEDIPTETKSEEITRYFKGGKGAGLSLVYSQNVLVVSSGIALLIGTLQFNW